MDNSNKIILDLCGGTGAWSKPYKEAGYNVRVITLPEYDVCTYIPPENVYGILAAPPCTEFSLAKGNKQRDFESAMEIVRACMNIVWNCRQKGKLKFWALENPRGFLRQFLGNPPFTFEQWEFGDNGIKFTDIWGYFKLPTKSVFNKPDDLVKRFPNGRTNGRGMSVPLVPEEYKGLGLNRAALRAITPQGFAKAFFKANQ
jgi:hypothetical protein